MSDAGTSLNEHFPFVQYYNDVGFSVPCHLLGLVQSGVLLCIIVTSAGLFFRQS